jgi:peptidoglycan/xylan/chitin deacetylase (PgdA/CDA1 family)
MRVLARQLKTQALRAGKACGLFERVRDSRWRSERLLILCYHGISLHDEHLWEPGLYMSPDQFESRLELLERGGYTVLPLGEALAAAAAGTLPPRSVCLTFDDGLYDFYALAFPALEARRLPVTVYLTTYYCEYNRPVYNLICSYLLWKARPRTWSAQRVLDGAGTFDLGTLEGRRAAWWLLIQTADRDAYSAADKHALVERLAGSLSIDLEPLMARRLLHLMTPAEVTELAGRGVDFQLHTHRHRTPLDRELFQGEIRENRTRIERLANARPTHFCYPSGQHRPEFLAWLAEEQVVSATTCDPGLVTRRSSPLLLPRFVDTSAILPIVFESWLTGTAAWLPRRRTYADR